MMRGNQAWGVRSDAHFDYAVLHHIVVLHFGWEFVDDFLLIKQKQ